MSKPLAGIPVLEQPPANYDQNYFRRLIGTLNAIHQVPTVAAVGGLVFLDITTDPTNLQLGQVYLKTLVNGDQVLGVVQPSSNANPLTGTVQTRHIFIANGATAQLPPVSLPSALVGTAISVASSPALPYGVYAFGKVLTDGQVTIELLNQSGFDQFIGQSTYRVVSL